MGFHLEKDEAVGSGFQRILLEQIAQLSGDVALASEDREKAIHEARKRCKRIRSVARLLRPRAKALYRRENATFRKVARKLSPFRDADARLDAFDELVRYTEHRPKDFAQLRDLVAGGRRRKSPANLEQQFSATAEQARLAERRLKGENIPNELAFELIEPGLRTTYSRGRKEMKKAYVTLEESVFHEWRKRVKDLGYQTQILRDLWPSILKRQGKALKKLGKLLGKEHDLTVVRSTLLERANHSTSKEDLSRFLALVEQRTTELQAEAKAIGLRLYAERPKCFSGRMHIYWKTWRSEKPAPGNAETKTLIAP
jgi:CHAD domain-containing protein